MLKEVEKWYLVSVSGGDPMILRGTEKVPKVFMTKETEFVKERELIATEE